MVVIRDRALRSTFRGFQSKKGSSPGFYVDAREMVRVLAAVGDRPGMQGQALAARLSRPGVTRAEQLDLARAGLDPRERADLAQLLEQKEVALHPGVRRFLEQILERAPIIAGEVPLQLEGVQPEGRVVGTTVPGAIVEVVNQSAAVASDIGPARVEADPGGHFQGQIPQWREGDIVRLRAVDRQGQVASYLSVVTSGGGADARNARVDLTQLGLSVHKEEMILLEQPDLQDPVSEPGAELLLVNERTGSSRLVPLDDVGRLGAQVFLPGRAGDSFSVRVSDGVHNLDFTDVAGEVKVPGTDHRRSDALPDPELVEKHARRPGVNQQRFTGPLVEAGFSPGDVNQGEVGDCYLASACAALAATRPDFFRDLIEDHGDGSYTVHLKRHNTYADRVMDERIRVDADLPVGAGGQLLYGHDDGSNSPEAMELWWPIVEKAFAERRGRSYRNLGATGGSAASAMEALTGEKAREIEVASAASPRVVWETLTEALEAGRPVCAGTGQSQDRPELARNGIQAEHAYTVLGVEQRGRQHLVKLRDPHGADSHVPGAGWNNGVFEIPVELFVRCFDKIHTVD